MDDYSSKAQGNHSPVVGIKLYSRETVRPADADVNFFRRLSSRFLKPVKHSTNMIVDIGSDATIIAIAAPGGTVYLRTTQAAGNEMDEAVMQFIKRKYNLLIGPRTAEAIKIEIGSAFPLTESRSIEVRGRHITENAPQTVTLTDDEIREALADSVAAIVDAVRVALERTPPEPSADIVERGIVLTGGGALLKNLDRRLSIETGLPVSIAEDSL